MEPYHSEGRYPFLKLNPYGSGLKEAIVQTVLSNSPAKEVFVLIIEIT